MTSQTRIDIERKPFVLSGKAFSKELTLTQDATRAVDLESNTLLAMVSATQKLVPFTDETATDGSALPFGIYVGETIPFADIVAGDLTIPVLVGEAQISETDLVIENAKTLATITAIGTTSQKTVREVLGDKGIYPVATSVDGNFENS